MRYNVFLLSAACFYFFMQTTNLVLGAPADTDRELLTVEIADSDQSHMVTKSLEKRGGSGVGRQACESQFGAQYELSQANCIDDLNYIAKCSEPKSTPTGQPTFKPAPTGQLTSRGVCGTDEICMEQFLEVYCRKRMPTTIKFYGSILSKYYCSPGVTAHDSRGTTVGFSVRFYSDDHYNNLAAVSYSIIQTNKRGILNQYNEVDGFYQQFNLAKDETMQACFFRQHDKDASFATLQWAQQ